MDDYLKAVYKEYKHEYLKALNTQDIKDKKIEQLIKKLPFLTFSHFQRIINVIQIMKHTFLFSKSRTITVCFKVTRNELSSIYAYIYLNANDLYGINTYVCAGPTFNSKDGEFRSRIILYSQMLEIYNSRYKNTCETVEKYILGKLESAELNFSADFYFCEGFTKQQKVMNSIDEKRLAIKLFVLCWMYDFNSIHSKTVENHINPNYQAIIYDKNDIPFYMKIYNLLGKLEYNQFKKRLACHYEGGINRTSLQSLEPEIGQKIFPLTVVEAIKPNDINFIVWRELYVTNLASNLVLNLICSGFAFVNNWCYIQNARVDLFDNINNHAKYMDSEIISDVTKQLKTLDKFNYIDGKMNSGPKTPKFYKLSHYMHNAMHYADSELLLTDLAICLTTEYVGRTLRDIPNLILRKEDFSDYEQAFLNLDLFNKHMFEFLYAIYCLNTKIGIIHGDLHLNNVTIHRVNYLKGDDGINYIDRPAYILFLLDELYMFPHNGLFSMIIDFSRSIMGDYKRLEHEFSSVYADAYFQDQRIRVLHSIDHYFPEFRRKYSASIESLLINNFSLMFKIYTALDPYILMTNILAMFSIDPAFKTKIKLVTGATALLSALINKSKKYVMEYTLGAINGDIQSVDDIEWPLLSLIKEHFDMYRKIKTNVAIVDFFNYNNEIVNEIEDVSTWGPLVSLDIHINAMKKFGIPHAKGFKEWFEFKKETLSPEFNKLIESYEESEIDLIQFESWTTI